MCDTNCLTCEYNSTYCTTCNQSSNYRYLNISTTQKCLNACLITMYPDLTQNPVVCVICQNNCQTCSSLSVCGSCDSSYFLWQSACLSQCPINTTVTNNVTGQCDVCSTQCLTCSGSISTCTSCAVTLILYLNNCISSCTSPLVYKPSISTCGPCDASCKTCVTT